MDLPFKTTKPVLEWRRIGDKILVIYDYMDFPKNAPARNLFAYTESGELLWQGEAFSTLSTDASVSIISEIPLVVSNFAGYAVTYDIETGRVVDARFTK